LITRRLVLRITPFADDPALYRLQVEGRLAGDSANEILRQELARGEAQTRPVVVDLSGMRFADEQAVAVLLAAAERGVTLANCSPWLSSLLEGSGR
jgi:anti-anti-sigma regulatory factor